MHPQTQLPAALACFGLVRAAGIRVPAYVREHRSVNEQPPDQTHARVPFTRAFCGRAAA